MITLYVENNRTYIEGASSAILDVIDQVIRYPSNLVVDSTVQLINEMRTWDGWVRLLNRPKTMFPWFLTGLIGYVYNILVQHSIPVNVVDKRIRPRDNLPEMVDIPLRDYQKEAVKQAYRWGRGVIDMPPRSGKTRIACDLQRRLNHNTIWIAPTIAIIEQTKRALDLFFYKNYSIKLSGKKTLNEASKYPIILTTPNTAVTLPDELYKSRQCLIIDEFHRAAATMYHDIIKKCDHIYYRFGMTGTFTRSGDDLLALHSILSNVLYKVDSKYLLDNKFLVPTHVVFVPVLGNLKCKTGNYNTSHGKFGISENKYRNQLVSQLSVLLNRTGRSVLILVNTKVQGQLIKDILSSYFPINGISKHLHNIEFVNSKTPTNLLEEILQSFIDKQEVKILIGTSVLGEGVDLPTADSLVYAYGQKAEVTLTQNAYRIGTAVKGKTHSILIDFSDRHHSKLLQHSLERANTYYDEPTFDVYVLDRAEDFSNWLNQFPYKEY
jgi:superfamily II DNA or RNA helicase